MNAEHIFAVEEVWPGTEVFMKVGVKGLYYFGLLTKAGIDESEAVHISIEAVSIDEQTNSFDGYNIIQAHIAAEQSLNAAAADQSPMQPSS